jgi:hypothetical protein
MGDCYLAHTRLAHGDWYDAGHHLALGHMTVMDHPLAA